MTTKAALTILTLIAFVAHQDVWLWSESRPLLFGFLPPGLTYHGAHTLASSLLLWLFVRLAWPKELEEPES